MITFGKFPIPYLGKGDADFNLVPVDYIVDATCYLTHSQIGENKVYHLTDPRPYNAREAYRLICEELLGKKPFYTIPSFLVSGLLSIPAFRWWVMVEKETIQYTHLKTQYDCSQAVKDLQASGVRCPELADYIKAAVRFYKQHRNDPDKVILVDRARKKDGTSRQIAGYRGHHWDDERAYPG